MMIIKIEYEVKVFHREITKENAFNNIEFYADPSKKIPFSKLIRFLRKFKILL